MTTATTDEWLANCPQSVRDFANKIKAGLRSARPDDLAQQVAVPPGYALVPIEPTLDMLSIGDAVWVDSARVQGAIATKTLYSAMLKAAPQPATYVPLTKAEIDALWDASPERGRSRYDLTQAIEQAVRGKT